MCDFTLKPETLYFPQTSVITYETSRCHSPKDGNIILCRCTSLNYFLMSLKYLLMSLKYLLMSLKYLLFILHPDRVPRGFGIQTGRQADTIRRITLYISLTSYPERIIIVTGSEFHKNSPTHTERVSWVEAAMQFSLSALSPSLTVLIITGKLYSYLSLLFCLLTFFFFHFSLILLRHILCLLVVFLYFGTACTDYMTIQNVSYFLRQMSSQHTSISN